MLYAKKEKLFELSCLSLFPRKLPQRKTLKVKTPLHPNNSILILSKPQCASRAQSEKPQENKKRLR